MASIVLNTSSSESYRQFLAIKSLPSYRFTGATASFPDEYASRIGVARAIPTSIPYSPLAKCFDYQRDIARLALRKRKFAVFADCGLGKSLIFFEYAKAVLEYFNNRRGVLLVTPAMVVPQMVEECRRFYADVIPVERVRSGGLQSWLSSCAGKLGIVNYEGLKESMAPGELGALILDESSVLKSAYGAWGQYAIELGRTLEFKLCGTGTPAPNDRIEYANHAVFLDRFPTVNSFLARYFVNRGQTQERWEIRPHAIKPFYRSLSDWCIFLNNPATYGWKDNVASVPPIHVHVEEVRMTRKQEQQLQKQTGMLFAANAGGITKRNVLSKIAKGLDGGETLKYDFIRDLVGTWRDSESTIIWCRFNEEQANVAERFQDCASIEGSTVYDERIALIAEFKAGERRELVSKPKVLGFGLNLQVATRQVFSSLIDSYEDFYQAVKRSNRIGSTRPLNVHVPLLDMERPMFENVIAKRDRVQADTAEQEALFREFGMEVLRDVG